MSDVSVHNSPVAEIDDFEKQMRSLPALPRIPKLKASTSDSSPSVDTRQSVLDRCDRPETRTYGPQAHYPRVLDSRSPTNAFGRRSKSERDRDAEKSGRNRDKPVGDRANIDSRNDRANRGAMDDSTWDRIVGNDREVKQDVGSERNGDSGRREAVDSGGDRGRRNDVNADRRSENDRCGERSYSRRSDGDRYRSDRRRDERSNADDRRRRSESTDDERRREKDDRRGSDRRGSDRRGGSRENRSDSRGNNTRSHEDGAKESHGDKASSLRVDGSKDDSTRPDTQRDKSDARAIKSESRVLLDKRPSDVNGGVSNRNAKMKRSKWDVVDKPSADKKPTPETTVLPPKATPDAPGSSVIASSGRATTDSPACSLYRSETAEEFNRRQFESEWQQMLPEAEASFPTASIFSERGQVSTSSLPNFEEYFKPAEPHDWSKEMVTGDEPSALRANFCDSSAGFAVNGDGREDSRTTVIGRLKEIDVAPPRESDTYTEVIDMDVSSTSSDEPHLGSDDSSSEVRDHDVESLRLKGDRKVTFNCPEEKEEEKKQRKMKNVDSQEKKLKKAAAQELVVEQIKVFLRPFYVKKKISKDDYKEIMRRAVPKLCKGGRINLSQEKIHAYTKAYVDKIVKRHNKQTNAPEAAAVSAEVPPPPPVGSHNPVSLLPGAPIPQAADMKINRPKHHRKRSADVSSELQLQATKVPRITENIVKTLLKLPTAATWQQARITPTIDLTQSPENIRLVQTKRNKGGPVRQSPLVISEDATRNVVDKRVAVQRVMTNYAVTPGSQMSTTEVVQSGTACQPTPPSETSPGFACLPAPQPAPPLPPGPWLFEDVGPQAFPTPPPLPPSFLRQAASSQSLSSIDSVHYVQMLDSIPLPPPVSKSQPSLLSFESSLPIKVSAVSQTYTPHSNASSTAAMIPLPPDSNAQQNFLVRGWSSALTTSVPQCVPAPASGNAQLLPGSSGSRAAIRLNVAAASTKKLQPLQLPTEFQEDDLSVRRSRLPLAQPAGAMDVALVKNASPNVMNDASMVKDALRSDSQVIVRAGNGTSGLLHGNLGKNPVNPSSDPLSISSGSSSPVTDMEESSPERSDDGLKTIETFLLPKTHK